MTERRYGRGRRSVAMVTTAIVSLGTAAAVGWAAAVPVGGSAASVGQPSASVATAQTVQQINNARANLQQVRLDLARLLTREDDLPRAQVANLSALLAQLPNVQVPQGSTAVAHVSTPVVHTTTGASGARP